MIFLLLLQAVWISPEVPGCCGCEYEKPPQPTVAGEWGEALNGLSVRVLTDSTRFDLGVGFRAGVGFRFDPAGIEAPPTVIDYRGSMFDANELTLRFERRGQSGSEPVRFEREPRHEGGPFQLSWQYCVELRDIGRMDWTFAYFLLTDEAEQIPPGRYAMIARFENDGGPMIVRSPRQRMDPENCWAPPESIWIGAIESAPIEVEIVDRPPTPFTVRLPTRIELRCDESGQFWVREDSTTVRIHTIHVRPGFHFGWRSWDAIYVDDAKTPPGSSKPSENPEDLLRPGGKHPNAACLSRSTGGHLERSIGAEHGIRFGGDLMDQGTKYRLRRKIVAFETSNSPHSHWSPERGDYRVLAEQIVEVSWTKGSICPDASSPAVEAIPR